MIKTGIVSVGCNNIQSVFQALQFSGYDVKIIQEPSEIEKIDFLVLPGVGSFYNSKKKLETSKLIEKVLEFNLKQKYILGICMGMQLMMTEGTEGGFTEGLDFVKGKVQLLNKTNYMNLGWRQVTDEKKVFLNQDKKKNFFYFMHNYHCILDDKRDIILESKSNNKNFCSAFKKENKIGVQFHPEKSGINGILFLEKLKEMIGKNF